MYAKRVVTATIDRKFTPALVRDVYASRPPFILPLEPNWAGLLLVTWFVQALDISI